MKKQTTVLEKFHSKLLQPPHILNRLIGLLVGEWRPTVPEQTQLTSHLSNCSDCRTAFSMLLVMRGEHETKEEYPEEFIQIFSAQFRAIHDQIEARKFEYIGAYAEKIVADGRDKADKQFPILAEYIKRCASCQSELEVMLDFLREC